MPPDLILWGGMGLTFVKISITGFKFYSHFHKGIGILFEC